MLDGWPVCPPAGCLSLTCAVALPVKMFSAVAAGFHPRPPCSLSFRLFQTAAVDLYGLCFGEAGLMETP